MMKNTYISCRELQPNSSDNERNSNYSSKDECDVNYENIFKKNIKSEFMQFEEHYSSVKNVEDKSRNNAEDLSNSFKVEKTVSSSANNNVEICGSKKRQIFICSHCPKVFSNSSAIAKHKLTHSDQRKYVCDICGKAFKRQDHLNGHKHTHKTNKPHACHLCDRSYSDARSLRRHYENQHQNEFLRCKEHKMGRESGCSSVEGESSSVDVFGILDETKCIKCDVCGKGFKNQSALNGHMRLHGGYGQTKNSISGPGEAKFVLTVPSTVTETVENVPLKMSQSPSGPSSSRLPNLVMITTIPNEVNHPQLHSLLTMPPSTNTIPPQHKNYVVHESLVNNEGLQAFDRCLSVISSSVMDTNTLSNINMDDLCLCLSPSSNNVNPSVNFTETSCLSSSLNRNISDIVATSTISSILHSSLRSHYSPITPAFSNQFNNTNINQSGILDYPTIVDNRHSTFENTNRDKYHYNWGNTHDSYISTTDSSTIDKQWSYYDLPINVSDIVDNNKSSNQQHSLPQISSSNNLQDLIMNLESIDPCNSLEVEWCKFSDGNDEINNIAESSETDSIIKKESTNPVNSNNPYNVVNSSVNESLVNSTYKQAIIQDPTIVVPHRKNKSRPAPIFIPPQTSAHMSRLRSPRVWNTSDKKEINIPPYTPPPMLSPQRKGSGLFNTVWQLNNRTSGNLSSSIYQWSSSISSTTVTALSNSYCNNSVISSSSLGNHQITSVIAYSPGDREMTAWNDQNNDVLTNSRRNAEPEHFLYQDECLECQPQSVEDSDGLPTSATPRINIGSQYQAQLPNFCSDKRRLKEDKRIWDILLWDPKQFKDTLENSSSLDLLMKIASSPAVKSCGLNMEYTFHLLCKFKGDFEKTLQALLEDSFVVYDYVYAETTNWTTDEINKFQERLKKHDRDFMRVALDLQSYGMNKSVKACVEFYYVWKQMNNVKDINRYRIKSSRKKFVSINNNSPPDDICVPRNLEILSSIQVPVDTGYNLRKKFPSGNQKLFMANSSYDYKTSSDGSSRDTSPIFCKLSRGMPPLATERTKKSLSYHCSQCKRKFAKSKALETHLRSHKNPNLIRDKLFSR